MKHEPPAPPTLGTHNGLAYALFEPDDDPTGGVVLLHGAGSRKESHFDFGRLCRSYGMSALAYDARGYGRSSGTFGPTAFGDALAMVDLLRKRAPRVAMRGSSMGGFCALHAASFDHDLAAVVALCPAPEHILLRGLRAGRFEELGWEAETLEPWLTQLDPLHEVVGRLGPETSLLLLHARGDEQVPYTVSEELHAAAHEPKRLLLFPGGHHRSLQHDLEVQNLSARFIERAVAARAGR